MIDRAQLSALGFARGAVRHRLELGRLRRVHHGVYAVGHEAIQTRGKLVAALLLAGRGAALSHRTAAALWKLFPSLPPFVEATTTITRPRNRRGLGFHHDRHEVDFHWRGQRLVVELDGRRYHGHRLAFERDRARDAELQLLGYTVVRFTWRQLRDEPDAVAARIGRFLSRPALRRAS